MALDNPPALRKIIQIAATPDTNDEWRCVYALCDDGTLWEIYCERIIEEPVWHNWRKFPDIPQEDR